MDFSKYRNKSFAEVSKEIEAQYSERYDPISQRGLEADMTQLRDKQEELKAQEEMEASLFTSNNMGASPQVPQQQTGTFNREASQSYNQKFQFGGMRDPLSYAPALGGVLALLTNKRADPIERNFIDEEIATRVAPRQTQFSNVDMSGIERGIQQQARGFTGQNINVSGGNAGAFIANELANQGNIMNAISQARMGQQQSDQRTQAMNAQEQARIDQFRQSQAGQEAQIQGQNARLALQYEDIDAREEGAFKTNRNNAFQSILGTLGSIGKENTQNNMILQGLGYDSMGNYGGEGRNSIRDIMEFLQKFRKNGQ